MDVQIGFISVFFDPKRKLRFLEKDRRDGGL